MSAEGGGGSQSAMTQCWDLHGDDRTRVPHLHVESGPSAETAGATRPDIPAVPTVDAEPSGAESPALPPVGRSVTTTEPAGGNWRERAEAAEAEIARLRRHVETLGREHARHALAVSAHKGRADQQESRAVRAEKQLVRFAGYAEEYEGLAAQAAQGMRNADLVTELRRRIVVLERQAERARKAEAKLAEVRQRCQEAAGIADLITGSGGRPIKASPLIDAILAITGTGDEPS